MVVLWRCTLCHLPEVGWYLSSMKYLILYYKRVIALILRKLVQSDILLGTIFLNISAIILYYTHSLHGQLLIGTTWTKTLCPQRNSKVSSPRSRYIATKSLSTRHIIAQQGSYDVTLQIQIIFLYYLCIGIRTMKLETKYHTVPK